MLDYSTGVIVQMCLTFGLTIAFGLLIGIVWQKRRARQEMYWTFRNWLLDNPTALTSAERHGFYCAIAAVDPILLSRLIDDFPSLQHASPFLRSIHEEQQE